MSLFAPPTPTRTISASKAKDSFLIGEKELKTLRCVDMKSIAEAKAGEKVFMGMPSKLYGLQDVRDRAMEKYTDVKGLAAEATKRKTKASDKVRARVVKLLAQRFLAQIHTSA